MDVIITAVVSFAVGVAVGWSGHWLALRRDKRKEFNDAALPVRQWLLGHAKCPDVYADRPSAIQLDRFESYLSRGKRTRFEAELRNLEAMLQDFHSDKYGQPILNDPASLQESAEKLLPFTELR
jgi:hypothetical protein